MNFGVRARSRSALLLVIAMQLIAVAIPAAQSSTGNSSGPNATHQSISIGDLETEHLSDPVGIQARQPRFRWLISSDERGGLQTAYQVLVASDLKKLQSDIADKWDSGKIISDNSVEVVYGGVPLASKETLF